ncbi:MAG: nucleoside deaminase [Phycisphaeraceae bacterium]|nr:nucleoside deaminase [Phycisphaeraceae bacterium]
MTSEDQRWMEMAIDVCRRGIGAGQSPFGAVIVRDGQILSCSHNTVWRDHDPTAHAEVRAIREACAQTGSPWLEDAVIYSTTEPCPMCFSAIHWARIRRIVYGAVIADAGDAGFRELSISNRQMKSLGGSEVELVEGFMAEECAKLFDEWKSASRGSAY